MLISVLCIDSDDEKFLGPNPTIASMSLGTTRDFLMKHKDDKNLTLKLALNNGELLVMKGSTQSKWLHSSMFFPVSSKDDN